MQTDESIYITTHVVCTAKQRASCTKVFAGRVEFRTVYHDKHRKAMHGRRRWQAFKEIVRQEAGKNDNDVIVICFGQHRFTDAYQPEQFLKAVIRGAELGTHIIMGGCRDFLNVVSVDNNLLWINRPKSVDFYVVYRQSFDRILKAHCYKSEGLEEVLSKHVPNRLMMFPFVSKRPIKYALVENRVQKILKMTNLFNAESLNSNNNNTNI